MACNGFAGLHPHSPPSGVYVTLVVYERAEASRAKAIYKIMRSAGMTGGYAVVFIARYDSYCWWASTIKRATEQYMEIDLASTPQAGAKSQSPAPGHRGKKAGGRAVDGPRRVGGNVKD